MDPNLSSPAEEPNDKLYVAMSDDLGLARVHGRGSYKISPILKEFAERMLDSGRLQFVVNLKSCEGMDSTFMGTIAGISQRLTKAGGEKVIMTHVSEKLQNLMKTLGLTHLVQLQEHALEDDPDDLTQLRENQAPEASSLESAEHILEAHETLVEISPDNLSKFKDCLQFLREDVQNRKP